MARERDFEDDPELVILAYLARLPPEVDLRRCEALITRLPCDLPRPVQKMLLRAVMVEVVNRAYVAIRQPDGDRVTAGHVIAAGIVMGLATERADSNYSAAPVDAGKIAHNSKEVRQRIAATWIVERQITSDSQFRKHEAECLEDFRAAFLELTSDEPAIRAIMQRLGVQIEERTEPIQAPANEPAFGTQYVPRPALHEEFERCVAAGAKVIAFVGQRGSGKSRLAEELARTTLPSGGDFIRLSAESLDSLNRDLIEEASKRRMEAAPDENHLRALARYVGARGRSVTILLEDVTSWDTVDLLIPANPTATYLLTSNNGEIFIPRPHHIVEVVHDPGVHVCNRTCGTPALETPQVVRWQGRHPLSYPGHRA